MVPANEELIPGTAQLVLAAASAGRSTVARAIQLVARQEHPEAKDLWLKNVPG